MAKKVSKQLIYSYALIIASLVAIAYGMLRSREGFQVDFTGKNFIGARASSSDAELSDSLRSNPNFSSGFRIVDVASGKVVFYVRNAVGTLDADNLLTNDTTIKVYDIFPGIVMPIPGDSNTIDSLINTKMNPNDPKSPIWKNIILQDTAGAISYYPALSEKSSAPVATATTSAATTAAPVATQAITAKTLTPLEIGAIAGGSVLGAIIIGFVIVKLVS